MRLGFVGFGEAGSTIAQGLLSAGAGPIVAYDVNAASPALGGAIRDRARRTGVTLVDTNAELAAAADLLLSTVTSSSALEAARQNAPHLGAGHLYADLNSVSPALKQEIAAAIDASGARFVEIAVMAPVLPYGQRVPMLAGGAHARAFADEVLRYGMRVEVLPTDTIGSAAAVKMCRSIVVKGLEALLVECVLGASRFGADDLVFASLRETFPHVDWKKLADYVAGRVAVHGERRAREMEEVAETLRSIGVDPIMAEATARRQDWSARLGLKARFGPEGPQTYREMLDAVDEATRAEPSTLPTVTRASARI